jgi:hypothetical protein
MTPDSPDSLFVFPVVVPDDFESQLTVLTDLEDVDFSPPLPPFEFFPDEVPF